MDRYRFVLPGAEEMYTEIKHYADLLDTMELKSPDDKYQESLSPRYRDVVGNDER